MAAATPEVAAAFGADINQTAPWPVHSTPGDPINTARNGMEWNGMQFQLGWNAMCRVHSTHGGRPHQLPPSSTSSDLHTHISTSTSAWVLQVRIGDTRGFTPYEARGVLTEKKVPARRKFRSLGECIISPGSPFDGSLVMTDFTFMQQASFSFFSFFFFFFSPFDGSLVMTDFTLMQQARSRVAMAMAMAMIEAFFSKHRS